MISFHYNDTLLYNAASTSHAIIGGTSSGSAFYCYSLLRQRGAVSPVVGRSLITRPARVQFPGWEARIIRCKNLALYIRDCEYLCLSDETLTAVGPFYLVSMPGEVKYPAQGVNV